jgi:alpha-1,2-mannosyltransferase
MSNPVALGGLSQAPANLAWREAASAVDSAPAGAPRLAAYRAAARKIVPVFAFGVFPALLTIFALYTEARLHKFTGDYYYAFWPAAHSVLHGMTPYVDPSSPLVARSMAFVYPAVAAVVMAPLALLPRVLGDQLFTLIDIAAVLATLRVLNVRDWRLYGVALLWPAVFSGWYTSNVTLLLGLGIALAWRYRERPAVSGVLIALVISFKVFLWPLGVWLLATRRYRASAYALASGIAFNAIAWATLGLGELHRYANLLHALTAVEGRRGYSVIAFALNRGIDRPAAYALTFALVAVGIVFCFAIGRRGDHEVALAIAIAVCLVATPLLWLHYFALLLVPLAITRPRLRPIWLLPLVTWFYPPVRPASWQVLIAVAVAAALGAAAVSRPRRPVSRLAT